MKTRFPIILVILALLTLPAFGTIPATTVWEMRPSVGSDTNGGGFDSTGSGTDMSQFNNKNAAACSSCQSATVNISTTDAVANGTTTVTSATGNFSAAITGNIVFFSGGTGGITAQWRRATFVSSTSITLDASIAASTGMTMNIGGALLTPTQLNTNMQLVAGNQAWIKATATITFSSTFSFTPSAGSTNLLPVISGYGSTRGDNLQVTFQETAGSIFLDIGGGANRGAQLRNVIIDCNGQSSSIGLAIDGPGNSAANISVKGCSGTYGIGFFDIDNFCFNCSVTTQSGAGNAFFWNNNAQSSCIVCVAYSNTTTTASGIFNLGNPRGACNVCIAANNTGSSTVDGFNIGSAQGTAIILNSVAVNNGEDGLKTQIGAQSVIVLNSVFYGNGRFGMGCSGCTNAQIGAFMNYNAYVGNVTANLNLLTAGANDQILTANPFVNSAGNNFAPNNTAGGGALLRALGFPGALTVGGTGFATIGALAPALGGGAVAFPIIQ